MAAASALLFPSAASGAKKARKPGKSHLKKNRPQRKPAAASHSGLPSATNAPRDEPTMEETQTPAQKAIVAGRGWGFSPRADAHSAPLNTDWKGDRGPTQTTP
jgi:hypothetical protein